MNGENVVYLTNQLSNLIQDLDSVLARDRLTKRERFAGLAMQNLQNVLLRKSGEKLMEMYMTEYSDASKVEVIAELAVIQADALLAVLERKK